MDDPQPADDHDILARWKTQQEEQQSILPGDQYNIPLAPADAEGLSSRTPPIRRARKKRVPRSMSPTAPRPGRRERRPSMGSAVSASRSTSRDSTSDSSSAAGLPSRKPPTERKSRTELKEMREAVKIQQEKEASEPPEDTGDATTDEEMEDNSRVRLLDFQSLPLVGRDHESKELMETLQRTCQDQASSQVLLILGGSGCGKTSLVLHGLREFQKDNHEAAFLVSGKFDANDTNVSRPYAAFLEVFHALVHTIMKHKDSHAIAERIHAALGAEAHKITGLIPSLRLLFHSEDLHHHHDNDDDDDNEDRPPAGGSETFHDRSSLKQIFRLLREMMRQICSPETPVILFLDDLQWGGKESLALFQDLSNDNRLTNLLLIGTYRDEEIAPLSLMLEEIGDLKSTLIRLSALEEDAVHVMVTKALDMDSTSTAKFSSVVYRKTGGNALFVTHFLDRLQELGYLQFLTKTKRWGWDLPQIQRDTNANDDLQQILAYRIQFLPATAQAVITRAASMGNKFQVGLLARILRQDIDLEEDKAQDANSTTGISPIYMRALEHVSSGTCSLLTDKHDSSKNTTNVTLIVQTLEKLGFLRHLPDEDDQTYRFAHDKIHMAALTQLNANHCEIHWRNSQILRRIMDEQENDEGDRLFFVVVEQLNQGSECIAEEEDRLELAALNLKASYKVKETSAFFPALGYAKEGLVLLAQVEHKWEFYHQLTTKLILVMAEMAMCLGQGKECMSATQEVINHARILEEKVPAYRLRVKNLGQSNKFRQAVEEGLTLLNLLGETFPREPNAVTIAFQLAKSKKDGFGRSDDDFCDLDLMTDETALLKMKIMFEVVFYAVRGSDRTQKFTPLLFFRMFQLTISYGLCNESIVAFAGYGVLLAGSLGEYAEGHRFGRLAMELQQGLGHLNLARGCIVNYSFLHHLKEPLSYTLEPLMEGFKAGMICDETADAVNALSVYFSHYLNCGLPLEPISGEIRQYLALMQELERERVWQITVPYAQLVANLMGKNTQPSVLSGDIMNLKQLMDCVKKAENLNGLRAIYAARMEAAYWFASYDMALRMIQHMKDLRLGMGQALIFNYRREVFFTGMTHLAVAKANPKNNRSQIWSARECIGKLKSWAKHGSADVEDLLLIINAELYAVVGRKSHEECTQAYEICILNSQRVGSLQNVALSQELAGAYHLSKGDHATAQGFLEQAYASYNEWNASKKASHLKILYPQMFTKLSVR